MSTGGGTTRTLQAGIGVTIELTVSGPRPGVCLVAVAGELDMATVPLLRGALRDRTAGRPAVLVVDLGAVTFLGAAGITLLVEAAHHEHGIHGRLHVVAPPGGVVRRALRLTGADTALRVHPDVDAALAASGGPTGA